MPNYFDVNQLNQYPRIRWNYPIMSTYKLGQNVSTINKIEYIFNGNRT